MNILKAIANDSTRDFAKDLVSLSVSEIAKSAGDIAAGFPFVSGAVAIWKSGSNVHDAFLMKDLSDFYSGVYEGSIDEDHIINKVTEEGHASDLLAEFTLRLISTNNKPGQTRIIGWLYYAKAAGEITEEDYMRLCVYVHDSFVADIKRLEDFLNDNANRDHIADSFYRAGLLEMTDMIWGGGSVCHLSTLGEKFYNILKRYNFFEQSF